MMQPGLQAWRADESRTSAARRGSSRHRVRHHELQRKLALLQQDNTALHAALFEAAQVHRRLCAPRLVRYGEFEIASEIFAVRYLPGDFFTIEEAAGGVILALGDVCGKGLAAGMWTPCLVGLVRAHVAAGSDPQAIITGVNREFCRMLGPLTSLFVARLDPSTGALDYCNAGHPPTLLLRADGRLDRLSQGGMLLGMADHASFTTGHVDLRAGDVLLGYSDGVLEARNDADQEFGHEHLEAQLRLARAGSAANVLFSLLGALQDFAALNALVDDTSLVVVRRWREP